MKKIIAAAVLSFVFAACCAADITRTVSETFASGGAFNGTVTFLNDYSNVTAVDGLLTGSTYGSDPITWIWNPTFNFASSFGSQYGGNFLMDGTTCGNDCGSYTYWVTFTWDKTNAPNLVLASPGGVLAEDGGNNINYYDPLVSGTISGGAVPEPSAVVLLATLLVGLGFLYRRRRISQEL